MLGPGPVEGFVAKMTGETEKHSWRTEGGAKIQLDFLTRYGKDYFLLMFIYREQLLANYVDTPLYIHASHPSIYGLNWRHVGLAVHWLPDFIYWFIDFTYLFVRDLIEILPFQLRILDPTKCMYMYPSSFFLAILLTDLLTD